MTTIEFDTQSLLDILDAIHTQMCMQTKELIEIKDSLELKAKIEVLQ